MGNLLLCVQVIHENAEGNNSKAVRLIIHSLPFLLQNQVMKHGDIIVLVIVANYLVFMKFWMKTVSEIYFVYFRNLLNKQISIIFVIHTIDCYIKKYV